MSILKRYEGSQLILVESQAMEWNKKDDSVEYLRLFSDEKLTWKIHLRTRSRLCESECTLSFGKR